MTTPGHTAQAEHSLRSATAAAASAGSSLSRIASSARLRSAHVFAPSGDARRAMMRAAVSIPTAARSNCSISDMGPTRRGDSAKIGRGVNDCGLACICATASRAASNILGTSYTNGTGEIPSYNVGYITSAKLGQSQPNSGVISWQASSRTMAAAAFSDGSAASRSLNALEARSRQPAKWSRFSGVSIPRNSKSAACLIAPSQMALAGEISVSVIQGQYGALSAKIESPKGAHGSALNPDRATAWVNVPAMGF